MRDGAGLRVENLAVGYGSDSVLQGVEMEVAPGQFAGLIGPNASGKSTFLKTVSRVLRPRSGRVLAGGKDVWRDLSRLQAARLIAVVPQDFPRDFPFTVEETVLLGRIPFVDRIRGERPPDRARAWQAMEATGTLALRDRLFSELAGGERQRVVLAKALAQSPGLLLLDEPTSHLDINHQVEILDLLKRLSRAGGVTVVVVLHDLNLASIYCDSLHLLAGGQLLAHGTPGSVVTRENVEAAYGGRVIVGRHPVHGCPQVTLVSEEAGDGRDVTLATGAQGTARAWPLPGSFRVHVVAGGGSADALMRNLARHGYPLSAGPLNAGDTDWQTGRALGAELITIPPFSAMDKESVRRAAAMMSEAGAVIVAPVPFGHGNLPVLAAAVETARSGTPVALMDAGQATGTRRDFAQGRATALLAELTQLGAALLAGPDDALAWVRGLAERRKGIDP